MTANEISEIRAAIAGERKDLADIVTGLPEPIWDQPTLCAGWRVREVVAHMTMPFRYSSGRFMLEMVTSRGNFNKMADRLARRDAAALSTGELASSLADNIDHPWKPPGGGFQGALSHDVIHGMDITVGLGLDRRVPESRLRMVLDGLTPRGVKFFGVDLADVRLCADDLDWSYGSGAPLSGAASDLLLVLCGRRLPTGRLRGEPAGRFSVA
ncbi:MAG TPA: maleylpyruvate isomerase family mycothiol-dependent enzyme [Pseudonocardiaceae bacterium]|jgi:uncharacterized protein (TIGR03083 family)|nr:maleylpyruvate isomerase family mycothiol-dependent enzyme [Pseudonocardiaceae bacterium]